ncbi:hypothetical protein GCM10009127_21510 [Alteraurantiacibacter aestuarii]|uniref:GNAT family N-acetyltransferase n=1 Tax=Alteraurantiacibacter aestuarii TaxID=650004 RepID=UPI0031E436D9
MTAISYHGTVNDLQGLALSGKGPFARVQWFSLLENGANKPILATARDGARVVCLPLTKSATGLEVLTNWYAFTWQPLVAGEPRPSLMESLARDLATRTHRIDLAKLPDEDGTASQLEQAFRKAGWAVRREECDTNHVLVCAGLNYADYLASRPGPLRTTLKRKAKKVEITLKRQFEAADWAAYEDIYRQSWKPEEGDPALLRAFAEAESDAGRFLFGMAMAQGKPVAAQFWTVDHGTAYIHKLAHLESAHRLSPGTTLTAALFAEVLDRDHVHLVDFGTGNDGYKADWMESARPRFHLTCLRRSDMRNWPLMGRWALRTLVSAAPAG